jgi:hypothetical protein
MSQDNVGPTSQRLGGLSRAWRFLFGSVFRFLLIIGLVLLALGATVFDGIIAGHLALYGVSAVAVGLLGRIVVVWRVQKY